MGFTLHLDAYKVIDKNIKSFIEQEHWGYKRVASRLLLPVLNAMVGVALIFEQLTRAIASLLDLDFKAAAKDLCGVFVQSLFLPLIITGSFIAPELTRTFLIKPIKNYHEGYERTKSYNRVTNFVISLLQIPSDILESVTMSMNNICTPRRVFHKKESRIDSLKRALKAPFISPYNGFINAFGGLFSSAIRNEAIKVLAETVIERNASETDDFFSRLP